MTTTTSSDSLYGEDWPDFTRCEIKKALGKLNIEEVTVEREAIDHMEEYRMKREQQRFCQFKALAKLKVIRDTGYRERCETRERERLGEIEYRIELEEFAKSCGWNGMCVKTDYTVSMFTRGDAEHAQDNGMNYGKWYSGEGIEVKKALNKEWDELKLEPDTRVPSCGLCCRWAHCNREICFGDSRKLIYNGNGKVIPAMLCKKGETPIRPTTIKYKHPTHTEVECQGNAPPDTNFYPCPSCYPTYWEDARILYRKNMAVDVEDDKMNVLDLHLVYTKRSTVNPSPSHEIVSCELGKNSLLYLLGIIQKQQAQIDELFKVR